MSAFAIAIAVGSNVEEFKECVLPFSRVLVDVYRIQCIICSPFLLGPV